VAQDMRNASTIKRLAMSFLLRASSDWAARDREQHAIAGDAALRYAVQLQPDDAESWTALAARTFRGESRDNEGGTDLAESMLVVAERADPQYAPAKALHAALLLEARGDISGSRKKFQEAIMLRPLDPQLHKGFAKAAEAEKDIQSARASFKTVLRQ